MTDVIPSTPGASSTNKSVMRRFMPLIVFVLLVILLGVGLTLNPRIVPSPLIGKPAPKFVLPVLNTGKTFTQDEFKGKVTLLNVWASWCYVCRLEHAAITQLSKQGIRVVGFNYKDEAADANAWLQQFGNPYEEVIADLDGRVGIEWGVYGAPETFVIDHHGVIRDKHIGEVDAGYIRKELMPLLNKIRTEMQGAAS